MMEKLLKIKDKDLERFKEWLPTVDKGSVIIMHDINDFEIKIRVTSMKLKGRMISYWVFYTPYGNDKSYHTSSNLKVKRELILSQLTYLLEHKDKLELFRILNGLIKVDVTRVVSSIISDIKYKKGKYNEMQILYPESKELIDKIYTDKDVINYIENYI